MGDFLKNIIYLQNHELLTRIANDNFKEELDKEHFIKKYSQEKLCTFN